MIHKCFVFGMTFNIFHATNEYFSGMKVWFHPAPLGAQSVGAGDVTASVGIGTASLSEQYPSRRSVDNGFGINV
jgi:hypothetical protein